MSRHPAYRISRIACLSLLCGFVVCGCSAKYAPGMSKNSQEAKMWEAKKFEAFHLYYAGEEIDGLPLTGISEASHGRVGIEWSFSHGTCELPGGFFAEGGCSLPLSIQNWSTCYRWASMFSQSRRPSGLFDPRRARAAQSRHLFDLRGAKAAQGEGGSELEIFTGRTTVVIWAHERNAAKSAARQLRNVRQAQPPMSLPPPAPGSLRGKLPCQGKPD